MRKFYDCGIDLGTTNSCIAVPNEDNTCLIIDNIADRMQVTPSVVWINKSGRIIVGQRAYTSRNVNDVKKEFKRDMGTNTVYTFKTAGIEKTPEELSAEILMGLRRDAISRTNKEMEDVIVTIPAAFDTVQREATRTAAKMAGFRNVLLLQEPIAAAIAYGAKPNSKDQYWLVFDFGGGTLDVSVISTKDGQLENVNNRGDNHLGGKDFDRILLDEVIIPKIAVDYDFEGGMSSTCRDILLKQAEQIKIELSNQTEASFETYDAEDNSGTPIDGTYNISRSEFESAISGIVDRAISIARQALDDSGINEEAVSKLILVGGSTYVPLIKERLQQEFDIRIESSINPMTVVAEGAALFAASQFVDGEDINETIQRDDEYRLNLEYPIKTSSETVNVVGRIVDAKGVVDRIKVDCIATENSESAIWSSGWSDFFSKEEGFFEIDIKICNTNAKNLYRVSAIKEDGAYCRLTGYLFEIYHLETVLELTAPPLPFNIGVMSTDGRDNMITWLIKKNTKYPVSVTEDFIITKDIYPNGQDDFEILLYEGINADNPFANHLIRRIHINEVERKIEAGSKIEITFSIDKSGCMEMMGFIPLLSYEILNENLGTSSENKRNYQVEMDEVDKRITEIEYTLSGLKEADVNVYMLISEFNQIKEEFDIYYDLIDERNDEVDQFISRFYDFHTKVILIERNEGRAKKQESDIISVLSRIDNNVNTYGKPEEKREYSELRSKYEKTTDDELKEHYLEKMDKIETTIVVSSIEWLEKTFSFYLLIKDYKDEYKADYWKEEGKKAIAEGNAKGILKAMNKLEELRQRTAKESANMKLADIREYL